jgi:enoyl-CoA hydratase/carnithine racemase
VPAERLADEVDALADRLARVDPDVMAPTKLMLNRAMDATGFAAAVENEISSSNMARSPS